MVGVTERQSDKDEQYFLLKRIVFPDKKPAPAAGGLLKRLSKKPRRVRGPQAANKAQPIFRGGAPQGDFRWACTSRKILCAGLGPEELASADPTVDVDPECVFAHFMRENARVEAKSLLSKKGAALF